MIATLQSVLCEPLMIASRSLPALIDEARAEFKGPPPTSEPPKVSCTLYGMDGGQVSPRDNGQRKPGSLIGLVQISGTMTRHGYQSWFSSAPGTLEIGRQLQSLNRDESVGAIVLAIHSPGGAVVGTAELAQIVYDIRDAGQTKIVTVADAMMASAAAYVGTAANEVYAIPSATLGSIGVVSAYSDWSKYLERMGIETTYVRTPELKARFTGQEPLSDAMLGTMQKNVDDAYSEFVDAMARNRGVSVKHVDKHFGGGETLTTREAIDAGMIDGMVSSVDEVLADLLRQSATRRR